MAAIVCEKKNGVAWIYLNRPAKLNSFTPESYALLRDTVRSVEADDGIDILVITGSGRAFATGADLQALEEAISSDDPTAIYEFGNHLPFDAVRDCTKVTIAAVNGLCLGAGLIIAALCDLIVASADASFGIPEGRVGIADPFCPSCAVYEDTNHAAKTPCSDRRQHLSSASPRDRIGDAGRRGRGRCPRRSGG